MATLAMILLKSPPKTNFPDKYVRIFIFYNLSGKKMIRTIVNIDKRASVAVLLYLLFATFWMGNGWDKFTTVSMEMDTDPNLTKFAVVNAETGELEQRIMKYRFNAPYGKNRTASFNAYFGQLGLSNDVAQFTLKLIGALEIGLGLLFFYIFIRSLSPYNQYNRTTMFGTRTLHRLCFKASVTAFILFMAFDVAVSDRMELWEHGTFLLLLLFTYYLFLQSDRIQRVEYEQVLKGWEGEKNRRKERNPNFTGKDRRGSQIDHGHH